MIPSTRQSADAAGRDAVNVSGFRALTLTFDPRGVAWLRLSHAFDDTVVDDLLWAFAMLMADVRVRAIVVVTSPSSSGADRFIRDGSGLASLLAVIGECPKPVIANVPAAGHGAVLGLCCVCDIVIAGTAARFAISGSRSDAAASVIAPYLLDVIGRREVQKLLLTNDSIDAERAVSLQLVTEVVHEARLDQVTTRLAGMILASSPEVKVATTTFLRRWAPLPPQSRFEPRLVSAR